MLRYLRDKRGQSILEYSLILGAIIVAILFMQLYVRRGLSGSLRRASDDLGEQFDADAKYDYTVTRDSSITEKANSATGVTTTVYDRDASNRTGNEQLRKDTEVPWSY